MGKRVTEMDDDGQVVTHQPTRAQRKSEQALIPWTRGPQTRLQRIKGNLVG